MQIKEYMAKTMKHHLSTIKTGGNDKQSGKGPAIHNEVLNKLAARRHSVKNTSSADREDKL